MTRYISALFILSLLVSPHTARADLTQLKGWPQKMAAGITGKYLLAPMEGVALVNLVAEDTTLEVIGSSSDRVWVWDLSGKVLPGWPATVLGTAQTPPSVGDIDGDGDLEVVQVARNLKYSDPSYVHAFHHDGKAVKGWPVKLANLAFYAVTLADLDGNGAQDVVVQVGKYPPAGSILVLSGDGKLLGAGWNHLPMDNYPGGLAAVGDVDGDGKLEVVYHSAGELTVRRSDGSLLAPFPLTAPSGKRFRGGVLLADISTGQKGKEIVCGQIGTASGATSASLLAYTAGGKAVTGFPVQLATDALGLGPPSAGDIDGDGKLELVVNVRGKGLYIVGAAGKLQGKPIPTKADSQASVQLIDLDDDGKLELLADNNSTDKAGAGYLEAYEADGTAVVGFPLRPTGTTMLSSPSAADLDGDGKLELAVVSTTLGTSPESYANIWSLPTGKATQKQWATYGFNARRSGCPGCAAATTPPWKADGAVLDAGADGLGADSISADLSGADLSGGDGPTATDASGERAEPPCDDCNGCTCRLPADPGAPPEALPLLLLLGLALLRRAGGRR